MFFFNSCFICVFIILYTIYTLAVYLFSNDLHLIIAKCNITKNYTLTYTIQNAFPRRGSHCQRGSLIQPSFVIILLVAIAANQLTRDANSLDKQFDTMKNGTVTKIIIEVTLGGSILVDGLEVYILGYTTYL